MRVGSLEERATLIERGIANLHGDLAIVHGRIDRLSERIERIERRLDLAAADGS